MQNELSSALFGRSTIEGDELDTLNAELDALIANDEHIRNPGKSNKTSLDLPEVPSIPILPNAPSSPVSQRLGKVAIPM